VNLVKLQINNGLAYQTYFIGEQTAFDILTSNLETPIAVNGLVKYLPQPEGDAVYKRLAITEYTDFLLSRAKPEEVPGYNNG